MANNVYWHISEPEAENIGKLVKSNLREITSRYDGTPVEPYMVKEFVELEEQDFMPDDYTDDKSYQWYCDNVGAKWCYIEDADDGSMTGYSAWSAPIPMLEYLAVAISEDCGHSVCVRMTYEDEFRNFVGVAVANTALDDDMWGIDDLDVEEVDGEDINIRFSEMYEDIDIEAEDFDWYGEYEIDGESIYPNEVCDDIVYNFFDNGAW